jgi:hypothetical protein
MLDDEDISELKANALNMDVSDLENALFELVGKKKAHFSKTAEKQVNTVPVKVVGKMEEGSKYGSAVQYLHKN